MENAGERAAVARVAVAVGVSGASPGPAAGGETREALADLYHAIDTFTTAERTYALNEPGAYNRAALTVHLLNLALLECERAGVADDDLRRRLHDVRRTYGR
jgi:hypothetical protein